jgi:hypothetical protein
MKIRIELDEESIAAAVIYWLREEKGFQVVGAVDLSVDEDDRTGATVIYGSVQVEPLSGASADEAELNR